MNSLVCICILIVTASALGEYVSFDQLYDDGLTAYGNQNWKLSISSFEEAIKSYKQYKSGVVDCYMRCKNSSLENSLLSQSDLGKITLKAVCNRECLDEKFGDFRFISGISREVKQAFEKLAAYQYLQYAYFKEGLLAKSVSSAHTFNVRYPEDEMMKKNMAYFRSNDDVTKDMFLNVEPRDHLELYDQAVQAYLKEDYENAAQNFESSLLAYYNSVEECYALCENESNFEEAESRENLDFHRQTAYLYIKVLECSLKCIQDLATDYGEKKYPNFVPVQYHYLQFSYYQANNFHKSIECAKTYLVFHPNDTVMLENLRLLSNEVDGIDKFEPRQGAVLYHRKIKIEVAMLKYSYQYFGIKDYDESIFVHFGSIKKNEDPRDDNMDFDLDEEDGNDEILQDSVEKINNSTNAEDTAQSDVPEYESMKQKTDDIIEKKAVDVERSMAENEKKRRDEMHYIEPDDDVDVSGITLSNLGRQTVDSKYIVTVEKRSKEAPLPEGPIIYEGTTLLANSTQLKGRERFAVDNMASEKECISLIDLELSFGDVGDGYSGKSSPHTEHEIFEGVTLIKAANLAKEGILPLSTAILYRDLSEKVRAQVQAYFNLPHLYFDYTHLVCRTSNPDSPENRKDLSHPIHADNCLLKPNGECVKELPAYIWRDYSAILYLNDGFEGGEFIFADSTARRVRVQVKPKCGRMVSFGAGRESFHGVKPVLKGRRCAVALWFTLSEERNERQRIKAEEILAELVSKQKDEL
ncbi:prolyl 3-hydroxylase 2-like [Styela clava]